MATESVCLLAQRCLSAGADGAAGEPPWLDDHVQACAECTAFGTGTAALRRALRYEVVGDVPDVAGAVRAAVASAVSPVTAGVGRAGAGRWTRVAAVFVAGMVAGAAFTGANLGGPAPVAAAPLAQRIVAAQFGLQRLTATVEILERGWHRQVPLRSYSGTLAYAAPESIALRLTDRTTYPNGQWARNDSAVVVDAGRSWTGGGVGCPATAQPACDRPARVAAVTGREPFADRVAAPLDLLVPVRSFALSGPTADLPARMIGGRRALGVVVTAAQVAPLLDGLRQVGDWRAFFPADPVQVWLDAEAFLPLELQVRPAAGRDRALWATRNGYDDTPGVAIFTFTLTDVVVNGATAVTLPPPPRGAVTREMGFVDGPVADPEVSPEWLPPGMRPYRTGTLASVKGPVVAVATWFDGRAWISVRSTQQWPGGRLFGDLSEVVSQVGLGGGGVGYASADGTRVAVHGADRDVVVVGSVGGRVLQQVAASLGVVGLAVPSEWAEATGAGQEALSPGETALLGRVPGFAAPVTRRNDGVTTAAYRGPGDRAVLLTIVEGGALGPPLDGDVTGVEVRGVAGRYTWALGELEWLEGGRSISLRSHTLSLGELAAVAQQLGSG